MHLTSPPGGSDWERQKSRLHLAELVDLRDSALFSQTFQPRHNTAILPPTPGWNLLI